MDAEPGPQPNTKERIRDLEAGDTLFRQGDPATAFFRLITGEIRLIQHTENGAGVVLHIARPGETFAEAALFADTYHCDAVARVASRVAATHKPDLLHAVHRDPAAMLKLARVLAGQVRDLRTRLEIRNIRRADERLLAWLRLRASGNPPVVELARTWTQIADEIGLTREAVYRALSAIRGTGRISIEEGRVRRVQDRGCQIEGRKK